MKTKRILKNIIILMIYVIVYESNSFGQTVQFTPITSNQYSSTVNTIAGFGIGTWLSTIPTNAALHVNTNLTASSTAFGPGEVFRTDAAYNYPTFWRMFSTDISNNPIPLGMIYNNNDFHYYIAAQFYGGGNYGDLRFQTNTGTSALSTNMTISGINGYVGIGTITPVHQLDVNLGSINIKTYDSAYMIDDSAVLWHNGIGGCIYVGVNAAGGAATSSTGNGNSFIGYSAGFSNTSGYFNTFIGESAGYNTDIGNSCTFVGHVAGFSNNYGGAFNTFMGDSAGYTNYNGWKNVFVGSSSGMKNNQGLYNVFVGHVSGYNNNGDQNVFMGDSCGFSNTTGKNNVFVGYVSGKSNLGNLNDGGYQNTFVGGYSGYSNTIGRSNVFIGFDAGYANDSSNWNTFTGKNAGAWHHRGNFNAFYGKEAGAFNRIGDQNTFIGADAGTSDTVTNFNAFLGCFAGGYNQGNSNTFSGMEAGNYNHQFKQPSNSSWIDTTSDFNCFYGYKSANVHNTGDFNTFIGAKSQSSSAVFTDHVNNLTNSSSLGANTVVPDNNQLILGNNSVNTGIGLSGDDAFGFPYLTYGGPRDKLEINLGLYHNLFTGNFEEPPTGDLNFYSGLQFRDLTSRNMPTDNPSCNPNDTVGTGICAVLSVDPHGRVILVKDQIGTGVGIGFDICIN